jgi:LPS export ABC transporter protein LptC
VTLGRLAAPLALVGLLAWMGWQLGDRQADEATERLAGQSAGYYLSGARLIEYDQDGAVRLSLSASRASQAEPGGRVEFSTVAVRFAGGTGGPWSLEADRGWAWPDTERVELEGDVVMQSLRQPLAQAATVRTPRLTLLVDQRLASSDAPVSLDFGRHQLDAVGLRADLARETLRLESKVNGSFTP